MAAAGGMRPSPGNRPGLSWLIMLNYEGIRDMKRSIAILLPAAGALALGLAACSEQTQEDGEAFVEGAAADTAANAEVVQEKVEDAAIVASDKVSEGAANMRDDMAEDEASEPPTDEELDGTD